MWTEILFVLLGNGITNTERNHFNTSDIQEGKVHQINTKSDKITPQPVPQIGQDYIAALM